MAKYKVDTADGKSYVVETADEQQAQPDWKGLVGSAVKEATMQPGTVSRGMMGADPIMQAKALPSLMGTAGAMSPIPGGATMGTVGGRQISNLALKAYGHPEMVPSVGSQVLEGGLAAVGDALPIPLMKKFGLGKQIGEAEQAAGVITRAPTKAVTPGSVGETLNNLEAQLDSGTIKTAQEAKDALAVVKQIYKNPRIYEQTSDIAVQSARVSQKVQSLINKVIPGRAAPAQAMAQAMTIPNMLGKAYKALPWQVKLGMLGGGGEEIVRRLLGH